MINKFDDNLKGVIFATSYSVIFGFSMFFTKGILDRYDVIVLLGWRFLFSFLAMLVAVKLNVFKVNFKNKKISKLIKLTIFTPLLYFIGESIGLQYLTTSESGLLISVIPIISLILSSLVLKELPTRYQLIGVILSVVGILINILSAGIHVQFNVLGYFFMSIAVLSAGIQAVISRSIKDFTAIEKTFAMMLMGMAVFFPLALIKSTVNNSLVEFLSIPFNDIDFIISISYLSIGSSIFAFFLSHKAIELLGANGNASFAGLSTIITILVGVVILHENFNKFQIISVIFVLGGVYVANFGRKIVKKYIYKPNK